MSVMVAPYSFAAAAPSANSVYYTDADATQYTVTGTTPTTKFTTTMIAARQQASQTYLGFWSVEVSGAIGNDPIVLLLKNGSALYGASMESGSNGDYASISGMFIHAAGGSPADVTYALQLYSTNVGTVTARNWKISWIKLGANDVYTTAYGSQTATTTSEVSKANLSFTPPSSGDYLVLGSFHIENSNFIRGAMPKLTDGTTVSAQPDLYNTPATGILPMVLTGISGSKSVDFTLRVDNTSNTVTLTNVVLVALRLDRFAHAYNTLLGADSAGTQATDTATATQTFTPTATAHFSLATWFVLNSSTSASSESIVTYDDGGTQVGTARKTQPSSTSPRAVTGSTHQIATYAASSRTQNINRKTEASSTITILAKSGILTLDLGGLT